MGKFSNALLISVIASQAVYSTIKNMDHWYELEYFPKEQRVLVEKAQKNKMTPEQFKLNGKIFESIKADLEQAEKALKNSNPGNSLDYVITAKGKLEKINQKVFDVRELKAEILKIERDLVEQLKKK